MFKRHTYPWLLVVSLLIGITAILAAANLWYLRKLHSRSLHNVATQSVMDLGTELARNLANQPVVQSVKDDPRRWTDFGRMVRSLKQVEPSLAYVSVNEGDVTLFHEDLSVSGREPQEQDSTKGIRVGRKMIAAGRELVPVITFSATVPDVAGAEHTVQVALRKDAVQLREEQASRMLGIMFRLSVVTLLAALGLAAVFGVWLFKHEMERQQRRRNEEHLAFAGLLADGIIHDVRNPMSSLRLDLQMLQKEAEKGEGLRLTRLIELASRARMTMDRMDHIMREFLYVSKPGSQEAERFDLNACLMDCIDLLAPRFERAGLKLESQLDGNPLETLGSSVSMKRAIINIMTNAKQVSVSGNRVRVATRREGNQAVVLVEDEGPGIKPDEKKKIFEMFVTGRPDGIGLGLHLAKVAVEDCGGTINVENRQEGGARFIIRVPCCI